MVVSEKSREKFLQKIEALRSRVKKLERSEAEHRKTEEMLKEVECHLRGAQGIALL